MSMYADITRGWPDGSDRLPRVDLIAPKILRKMGIERVIPPPAYSGLLIEFDGGSRNLDYAAGCTGDGYGSYRISEDGFPYEIQRVDHVGKMTSNAAECLTLVRALIRAKTLCDPGVSKVHIIGDSNNTLLKVRKPFVTSKKVHSSYRAAVSELSNALQGWASVTTEWRGRRHSVNLFGH